MKWSSSSDREDVEGSLIRALAGFKRTRIAKGEAQRVAFTLDDRQLRTVDEKGQRAVRAGEVTLWVGGSHPTSVKV